MAEHIKVAAVQMDVVLGQAAPTRWRVAEALHQAARNAAQLVVFPECALTGYCFDSADEACLHAEPIPGPSTDALAEVCRRLDVHAVFGLLEQDGPQLFNACALVGPEGIVGAYRKIHLPFLGVDRFATPGDRPFGVWPVRGARA